MFRTVPLFIIRSIFTVQTAMVYVIQVFADSLQAGSERNSVSILTLLASSQQDLYDIYHCRVHSEKLLMLDRGTVRNL